MEATLEHRVDLPHQNVCRHLVFGPAELAQGGQQDEVIERLRGQGQIERAGRGQQIPLLLRRAGRGSICVGMTIYLKVTVSLSVTSALI